MLTSARFAAFRLSLTPPLCSVPIPPLLLAPACAVGDGGAGLLWLFLLLFLLLLLVVVVVVVADAGLGLLGEGAGWLCALAPLLPFLLALDCHWPVLRVLRGRRSGWRSLVYKAYTFTLCCLSSEVKGVGNDMGAAHTILWCDRCSYMILWC